MCTSAELGIYVEQSAQVQNWGIALHVQSAELGTHITQAQVQN